MKICFLRQSWAKYCRQIHKINVIRKWKTLYLLSHSAYRNKHYRALVYYKGLLTTKSHDFQSRGYKRSRNKFKRFIFTSDRGYGHHSTKLWFKIKGNQPQILMILWSRSHVKLHGKWKTSYLVPRSLHPPDLTECDFW